jgi:Flp pilus assembly protein TadG
LVTGFGRPSIEDEINFFFLGVFLGRSHMLVVREVLLSERGNALMIVAAVMPLLIGAGAVGIDVAQWALEKRHLQRAADSGAIAGAHSLMQKGDFKSAVARSLDTSSQVTLSSTLMESAPTTGSFAGDTLAVRVLLSSTPNLSFVSFFMSGPTTIQAEAVARISPDPRFCMVALEDGPSPGFDFAGASGVNADCGLMTNSRAKPSATTFGGNSTRVSAPEVAAVGVVASAPNFTSGTTLMSYQAKIQDPYAYAPDASSYATNCTASPSVIDGAQWTNKTLSAGCWSGGLSIKTKVTLAPGTYVIKGGTLDFASGAEVTSTGPVTFIMTGDTPTTVAKLSIGSTAIIKLAAPTTGPLRDILFYQDRKARYLNNENVLTGNGASVFDGGFYLPGSNVLFIGNSGASSLCTRIVALRLSFTGSSTANISCTGTQRDKLQGQQVRLVS